MLRSDLHYELPPGRIAQQPAEPRDTARLLVVHRRNGRLEHRIFSELGDYLRPGDCLVINDTRVIPARFWARRASGGRIEGLFLRAERDGAWHALLRPSARLRVGELLTAENDSSIGLRLLECGERGAWRVSPSPAGDALELLGRIGEPPLPPYIERRRDTSAELRRLDAARYQTVYARHAGAIAAPTAGLHFTPELLARLAQSGVRRTSVTLHVGAGTFLPIETEDLRDHVMHREWFEVGADAAADFAQTRAAGGALVAVGTTAARVLESMAPGQPAPTSGWTDLFIYPPYKFRNVDRLITNFHLPGSTLLALVFALAGRELVLRAYREAIDAGYRFYSFGDAMLIL